MSTMNDFKWKVPTDPAFEDIACKVVESEFLDFSGNDTISLRYLYW